MTPKTTASNIRHRLLSGLVPALLLACGDSTSSSNQGAADSGASDGGVPDALAPDPNARITRTVAFDPARFELPEGLAIDGDVAYVGLALTGEVVRVDLKTGVRTPFGQVPMPPMAGDRPGGVVTGLAVDGARNVYATLDVTAPPPDASPAPVTGIYRITPAGGIGELFASSPAMIFPNGMAVDGGALYVTDSQSGSVFKVSLATGAVNNWLAHDTLKPLPDNCGPASVRLGANGITLTGDALFVSNTDRAHIVRIPIEKPSGAAGLPSIVLGPDCAGLFGLDDLRALPTGDLVFAVNYGNRIGTFSPTSGAVRTLYAGAPLDGPASLELRPMPLELLVTNSAFGTYFGGMSAKPSLVMLALP
jgi:hypothetical protein